MIDVKTGMLTFSGISVGDRRSYKGNSYNVMGFCQIKIPGAGWVLGVRYIPLKENNDTGIQEYSREILDFKAKFKKDEDA